MAKDVILLGELAARGAAMLDIRCGRCDRHGRLSVQRLLAQYGPDAPVRRAMQGQIGIARTGSRATASAAILIAPIRCGVRWA